MRTPPVARTAKRYSLDAVDEMIAEDEKQAAVLAPTTDAETAHPPLEPARFEAAFARLLTQEWLAQRPSVHNLLVGASVQRLEGHLWFTGVGAQLSKRLLEDPEVFTPVLQFMRSACSHSTMLWRIEVDDRLVAQIEQNRPLTTGEKLKKMEKKNPALRLLQERFGAFPA